ncbi:hypothetical protein N9933_00030 [bacterium]|nr:hypothetical protein [bacterium]
MTEVEKFHILAHILISLIGAVLLFALWYNIRKRFRRILEEEDSQRVDTGLVYLGLALVMWVFSGSWALMHSQLGSLEGIGHQVGNNLFSTANNLFLLLALFHFSYAPTFIYNNKANIRKLVIAILGILVLSIVLTVTFGSQATLVGIHIGNLPDVILSGFLSYLLIVSFFSAFNQRGLRIVGFIAVSTVALMFISQLPEIFTVLNDSFINNLVKIVAKTSLISIFLVLATIWVIQLAHTPVSSEIAIHFQDWSLVKITIPSRNLLAQTLDFGSKTTQYKNLLKFGIRRKYGEGIEQSIVVGSSGEIKSQTYLSRIIENMNEILNPEEEEKLERKDLFTFIGQGRYRLRVLPENILIDPSLLEEFTKGIDNQGYTEIVTNCDSVANSHS